MYLRSSAVFTFAVLLVQLALFKAQDVADKETRAPVITKPPEPTRPTDRPVDTKPPVPTPLTKPPQPTERPVDTEPPVPYVPPGNNCNNTQCVCSCHPDPHFNSFHNIYFDYHGGCDVVLVKSSQLNVHIRTMPYQWYASVSNVAVEINSEIFELTDSNIVYFNMVPGSVPTSVGGKPLLHTTTSYGYDSYEIVLNSGSMTETIEMTVNPSWPQAGISIVISLHGSSYGLGVSGLCGTWSTPGLMSRDNTVDYLPLPCSGTCYGEHWQFDPMQDGPFLFKDPPLTNQCTPPLNRRGRQLLRKQLEEALRILMTPEEIKQKCTSAIPDSSLKQLIDNCIYDVTYTQDDRYFELPAYLDPVELRYNQPRCIAYTDDCRRKGGDCMLGCDKTKFYCIDSLCYDTSLQYSAINDKCFCAIPKDTIDRSP